MLLALLDKTPKKVGLSASLDSSSLRAHLQAWKLVKNGFWFLAKLTAVDVYLLSIVLPDATSLPGA